jgi:hypothetical protein
MSQPVSVITAENAACLVRAYFELNQVKDMYSDFSKFNIQRRSNHCCNGMSYEVAYDVFWAIRIVENKNNKYDFTDIEYHLQKNPVLGSSEDKEPGQSNQVGLLSKAIDEYRRSMQERNGTIALVSLEAKL